MTESPRTRSFTARTLAPMRRRVRALRRLLGADAVGDASFRIDAAPGVPVTSELFSPIERDP